MDADTLQYRADKQTIFISGVGLVINPGTFSLPSGVYRYGELTRLVPTPTGTQAVALTPDEQTALNDAWPDLVILAVDAYAAHWIQNVMGDRNQQTEDLVSWVTRLQVDDALSLEEQEYANALQVWIDQIKTVKAAKKTELEDAAILEDEEYDFFSEWPPFPPEVY